MNASKDLLPAAPKREKQSLFSKALHAFDMGDPDLASRILVASYHHHTRPTLTVTERLDLWWCLAWFAFYENNLEKAEQIVRQIISLEENLITRRLCKIIYAKYVLAMFCSSQQKKAEAKKLNNEVSELINDVRMNEQVKKILQAQFNACTTSPAEQIKHMTAA